MERFPGRIFTHACEAAISSVQPMKSNMTEKASSEAFLPTASIRKTAEREPTMVPIQRREAIQAAWSSVMVTASWAIMEGRAELV